MTGGFGSSPLEAAARDAFRAGQIYVEQFDYVARFVAGTGTALAANNVQTVPVNIDNGWDFVIQQYLGTWYDSNGALDVDPNALVEFKLDSGSKLMSSAPVHWLNIMGNFEANKIPNQLPMPVLVSEKSTYIVTLTNLMADAPDNVEITYRGFKVYYKGRDGKQYVNREQLFGRVF